MKIDPISFNSGVGALEARCRNDMTAYLEAHPTSKVFALREIFTHAVHQTRKPVSSAPPPDPPSAA